MRIFVCEFITGGGWQDRELPASLAHEGEMMLTVLLDDLQDAGYRDLVCTRDGRLTALPHDIDTVIPAANAWDTWESIMRECDAAWIIAPETDAVLFRLVQLAEYCDCRIIGCSAGTVRMATSKQRTAGWLQKHHIPTEPVFNDPEQLSENREGWI
ncbi:MAG TPA: hypothetical protein VJ981_06865, partial [Gammaproteobacteria bacterium]|nr:hypothetical protein [Gammaproteobacteria bacterium]